MGSAVTTHGSTRNQMFWKNCSQTVHDSLERWCHYRLIITVIQHIFFLRRLHPALCSVFLQRLQSLCSHMHAQLKKNTDKKKTWKMAVERSNASKADGGQINKAFGYFKKMTEEARRRPGAVLRLLRCVYLESYSWGEGKEQQSSNRATESLFLVLFAVGSFRTPSLLAGNKEQHCEKTNGTGPRESKHINIKIRYNNNSNYLVSFFCRCGKSLWC